MDRPQLQSYLKLIAKKAWYTWRKLPAQHRSWIAVDDLIQDGLLFARFNVLPRYKAKRCRFSTLLSISLDNFYKNLLNELYTQKRNSYQTVSASSVQYKLGRTDETAQKLHAIQGLTVILSEASPLLRGYLNHWIFQQGNIHTDGYRFAIAGKELRKLAAKCGFERSDFAYLLSSESWRQDFQPIQKKFLG